MDKKFLFRVGVDISVAIIWSVLNFYDDLGQTGRMNLLVELFVMFFVFIVIHRGILASLNRGIYNSKRMFVSFVYVTLFCFMVIVMGTTPAILNLPLPIYSTLDANARTIMAGTNARALNIGYTFLLMYFAMNIRLFKTVFKMFREGFAPDDSKVDLLHRNKEKK
jgi:hypothetical protein